MPRQARGFWHCEYCGLTFDRQEEVAFHEAEECPRRRPHNWREDYPPPYPTTHYATDERRGKPPQRLRRRNLPLLASGEQENLPLSREDTEACQAIQLYETEIVQNEYQSGGQSAAVVGVRCVYCQGEEDGTSGSTVLPRSIAEVGDCVRQLMDSHLTICNFVPEDTREILSQYLRKRRTIKEGTEAWEREQEYRRILIEYCANVCHNAGIANKNPPNPGIYFLDYYPRVVPTGAPPPPAHAGWYGYPHHDRPPPHHVGAESSRGRSVSPSGERYPVPSSYNSYYYGHGGPGYYGMRQPPHPGHQPPPTDYSGRSRPIQHEEGVGHAAVPPPYYEMPVSQPPVNFPFIQDQTGDWICRFCSHLHPSHRDPQHRWSAANKCPPPPDFIDHHMSLCRSYRQGAFSPFAEYPAGPPQYPYGPPHSPPGLAYPQSRPYWDTPGAGPDPSRHVGDYASVSATHRSQGSSSNPSPRATPISRTVPPAQAEAAHTEAIKHLTENDRSCVETDGTPIPEEARLVLDEDRLLLTDYFYYLMKQLRLVRFSEADRKTRGGKRENIQTGYGGLQCVHCADAANARKFFWSNVDRLANSFAEIPGHILKCRRCPEPTRNALQQLKMIHPKQMAELPRGSQKVFFRRVWRRIHGTDPDKEASALKTPERASDSPKPAPLDTKMVEASPTGTSGSDQSPIIIDRSSVEAAKTLAGAAMQGGPPSPSSRVLLAIPEDKDWLSDTDCFIRRQIEVFCANADDVVVAQTDRKYPVIEGQVGIRCVHCAMSKHGRGATGQAVAFPFSVNGIYESVREFQRLHFNECTNLPENVRAKFKSLKGASSLSSVLRKYYVLSAKALGLKDTKDGIAAGGESIPLGSQTAFAFSEELSKDDYKAEEKLSREGSFQDEAKSEELSSERSSLKRSASAEAFGSPESKKSLKSGPG